MLVICGNSRLLGVKTNYTVLILSPSALPECLIRIFVWLSKSTLHGSGWPLVFTLVYTDCFTVVYELTH